MANKVNETALSRNEAAMQRKNAAAARRLTKKKTKIQESFGDKILLAFTTFVLILVLIIVGYPVIYVVSCSFSADTPLSMGRVILWPLIDGANGDKFGFSFKGYEYVFRDSPEVLLGYWNTIRYTVCGVIITMIMQILCAYPLSKRKYQGRNFFMAFFFVTTMVGAGMVPTLLVRQSMGLYDNFFAVLLAGILSVHNMIILRTCFQSSIPGELYDAAAIDGANDFQTLIKIALPLSKATLSVLTLYSAVGNWNEYFTSMIYLPTRTDLHPLQLVLRPIMTGAKQLAEAEQTGSTLNVLSATNSGMESVIFALIVVATVPVLIMYFVVQKYFEKGVMVGSVKG